MSGGEFEWQVGTSELVRAAMERMASVRREYGEFLGIVAELVGRGVGVELGYGSAEKMLVDLVRVGRGEAGRTVARARALHDSAGLSVRCVRPRCPRPP